MTGKTHQVIGVTAGLAVLVLAPNPVYGAASVGWALVLASIGAILPDIDQPSSKIWKALPFGGVAGELVNPLLEHRNFTHSFLGAGTVGIIVWKLLEYAPEYWEFHPHLVFAAFMASYFSHLLADMVTVQGIPLFFPAGKMYGIPPVPFQGLRIETGQWFENFIVFPTANALLVSLTVAGWPTISTLLFR